VKNTSAGQKFNTMAMMVICPQKTVQSSFVAYCRFVFILLFCR